MSYQILKWIHLSMLFVVLLQLGGAAIHMISGGAANYSARKPLAIYSGIALLLVLITGILLAQQIYPNEAWHGWIYALILVWLYLGGITTLIHQRPKSAGLILISIFIISSLGIFLAIFKPW